MSEARGPEAGPSRILRGMFFIILATTFFVVMNTGVKLLRAHLPTLELIWARTLGHTLFIFMIFGPSHGWGALLAPREPGAPAGHPWGAGGV